MTELVGVVVPHTHWDREWYAPLAVMHFHLVRFVDELLSAMEQHADLVFVLDGQTVIVEDYLAVRPDQRDRITALVRAGRLRVGPFYVQPDELHVSGESLVRNLAIGVRDASALGRVMREGYLPDTFGHVAQLPQVLRGFGIETFYAMRGLGVDADEVGSEFWWEAPDGSRVLASWLHESYSSAAVLTDDAASMSLRHASLVRYGSLHELLERLAARAPSGVLLLLNGGDHVRVQPDAGALVAALAEDVEADLRLGGLEEYHALVDGRVPCDRVVRGELRRGRRHDVFDGIASTRTALKAQHDRVQTLVCDLAERLDALAHVVDGHDDGDVVAHLWRSLVVNHAHDSICGCSIDAVHDEMAGRFRAVEQLASTVVAEAARRLALATAARGRPDEVPVTVVNPSAFVRSGRVAVDVVTDLDAPLGVRVFGWQQTDAIDWSRYALVAADGSEVAFTVTAAEQVDVLDTLDRRKEVLRDRVHFVADDVPALGVTQYRLVPSDERQDTAHVAASTDAVLRSDALTVRAERDGTLTITHLPTGRVLRGVGQLLDDGDAGDAYGHGRLDDDAPRSSLDADWTVTRAADELRLEATMTVPAALAPDRRRRSTDTSELSLCLLVRLGVDGDRVDLDVLVDNTARDHRLRLRVPTHLSVDASFAETAFGQVARPVTPPPSDGWHEPPSGAEAMGRFVTVADDELGVQVMAEGLHEYRCDDDGTIDVTLLRCVGWLSRLDHPQRPHKIGPELATPGAQCLGKHAFRLALRPFAAPVDAGSSFRAVEAFAVPLVAATAQGSVGAADVRDQACRPGLTVTPAAAVLSALKTADDGDGVVVRLFNSAATDVVARLAATSPIRGAWHCELDETAQRPLDLDDDGVVAVQLGPARIATVRLHLGHAGGPATAR